LQQVQTGSAIFGGYFIYLQQVLPQNATAKQHFFA
jgi:hypothetical protein